MILIGHNSQLSVTVLGSFSQRDIHAFYGGQKSINKKKNFTT